MNIQMSVFDAPLSRAIKHKALILLGAPGCGKGTQGSALGALPGVFHCACGDVFRSITPTSPLGQMVASFSSRGDLVPDEVTIKLWRSFIDNRVQSAAYRPEKDVLLLDGIPRNLTQASLLNDIIQVRGVFHLRCDKTTELVERLRRRALRENRLDDAKDEVIMHRLEVFQSTLQPLLNFYPPELVHTIIADQQPTAVLHEILGHIHKLT